MLLAVSTLSAASPIPTVSQVNANAIKTSRTNAVNQSPSPALGSVAEQQRELRASPPRRTGS